MKLEAELAEPGVVVEPAPERPTKEALGLPKGFGQMIVGVRTALRGAPGTVNGGAAPPSPRAVPSAVRFCPRPRVTSERTLVRIPPVSGGGRTPRPGRAVLKIREDGIGARRVSVRHNGCIADGPPREALLGRAPSLFGAVGHWGDSAKVRRPQTRARHRRATPFFE